MFGVPSIEERIQAAKNEIANLDKVREQNLKEFDRIQERLEALQAMRNKEVSRVGELTLLKDVRDGKLLVLDVNTMEPARIKFL
jgi:flagellar biosynthesis chaperone FliJ